MGCQRAITKNVIDKEADYLLSVKSNQPSLEIAFDNYFRMDILQSDEGDTPATDITLRYDISSAKLNAKHCYK